MKIINNTSETSRYVNCCHIYPLTHTMYSETLFKSLISICFHCILTKNTHARLFNGAFIHNDRTKNVYKSTTKTTVKLQQKNVGKNMFVQEQRRTRQKKSTSYKLHKTLIDS